MRLILAGTPEFAARPFQAVLDAGFECAAVYTQPDRPSGRGRKLTPSPVKQLALDAGLSVRQPLNFKDPLEQQALAELQADLMLVIAYGLILPQAILDTPQRGCVNLHASLLPRWRGAAPIQRAIESGDAQTGLCLMQMEAGLDTGPVLAQAALAIDERVTGGDLHDQLVELACQQLPQWLREYEAGQLSAVSQDDVLATYAHKLSKVESQLDWSKSALEISRKIRAFDPWPGTAARLGDQVVKLSGFVGIAQHGGEPGQILSVAEEGMHVACGDASVILSQVQFPGARRMSALDAARGRELAGLRFGAFE